MTFKLYSTEDGTKGVQWLILNQYLVVKLNRCGDFNSVTSNNSKKKFCTLKRSNSSL